MVGGSGDFPVGMVTSPRFAAFTRVVERVGEDGGPGREGPVQVWYQPIIDASSGRLVGADAVAFDGDHGTLRPGWGPVAAPLVGSVLRDLSSGPAAVGDWWVRLAHQPDALVDALLRSAVDPRRIRHAVRARDLALGRVRPSTLGAELRSVVGVGADLIVADDPADRALVRSVVAVAEQLGVEVVAEGVEGDDEVEAAIAAGISLVQGFRWGSPGSLEKLLATWSR